MAEFVEIMALANGVKRIESISLEINIQKKWREKNGIL